MNTDKLDGRLIEEIRIRRENGLAAGKSLDKVAQETFPVTIELTQPIDTPKGLSRQQVLKEIEKQVEQFQSGVVDNLRKIGITEYQRQILSNSISATLTLYQIQKIARRNEVGIIRLVKVDKVVP